MILGGPLLGQRVTDIVAVIQAVANYPGLKGRKLRLAAQGKMAAPATFAAALAPKVDSLYLSGGLVSYRSIVDTEEYFYSFANFAPNLLLHTDLPEVIAGLAPRTVTLAGSVDAAGKRAPAQLPDHGPRLERAPWWLQPI